MTAGNAELTRRWWTSINERRTAPLDLCDERVEIVNPAEFPVRGTFRGHRGVERWLEEAFDVIDDLRVTVEGVVDAGNGERAVSMLRLTGIAAHTRIPISATWAAVMTFRDGRLVRAEGYVSRREALRAVGLRD